MENQNQTSENTNKLDIDNEKDEFLEILNENAQEMSKGAFEDLKTALSYIFLFSNAILIAAATLKFKEKHFLGVITILSMLNIVLIVILYLINSIMYSKLSKRYFKYINSNFERIDELIIIAWNKIVKNNENILNSILIIIFMIFLIDVIFVSLNILTFINK